MADLSSSTNAIKHLLVDAGAGWVLWALAGLSLVSMAITLERWLLYRRVSGDLTPIADEFHKRLENGDLESTRTWLEGSPLIASRIAAAGLWLKDKGPQAVQNAMASRMALERDALETRLSFLATLGNNAPFVGLFGTVIGVIQAFEALGQGSQSTAQMASGDVMAAIAEALVATAVGIGVALPAVAAYNYLDRRVQSILAGAEVLSNLVLAYISQSAGAKE